MARFNHHSLTIIVFLFLSGLNNNLIAQDSPCTAVAHSTTLINATTASSANWTTPVNGIVNPTCVSPLPTVNYWIKYTAASDEYAIDLDFRRQNTGSNRISDVGLQVFSKTGTCSTSGYTLLRCEDQATTNVFVHMSVTPGVSYYVRVFDIAGGTDDNFRHMIMPYKIGQTPCSAILVPSLPYSFTGTTVGGNNYMTGGCNGNEPQSSGTGNDYFFAYDAPALSWVTVNLSGTTAANYTEVSVLTGSSCESTLTCLSNGSWGGGLQAKSSPATANTPCRTVYFRDAGRYYFKVDASLSASGPFTLNLTPYTVPSPGDFCTNAITLSSSTPVSVTNTNCAYTTGPDDPTGSLYCAGTIENTIWFKFLSDGSGTPVNLGLSGVTCNQGYVTDCGGSYCYYGASYQFGVITSSNNSCSGTWSSAAACRTGSGSISVSLPNSVPTVYYMILDGNGGAECGFTITASNVAPLPVEMMFFDAKLIEQNKSHVFWATASEKNNDFFMIQRSRDGLNFEDIGRVNGVGNSNDVTTYDFMDNNAPKGYVYYRLKQVDYDGKFTYTDLAVIKNGTEMSLVVSPNPARDVLSLKHELAAKGSYELIVVTPTGSEAMHSKIENHDLSKGLNVDISSLPKGMYHLRLVNSAGAKYFARFIKE